jgi:acyl-coenzyme A thioesterase PaaI-like protein
VPEQPRKRQSKMSQICFIRTLERTTVTRLGLHPQKRLMRRFSSTKDCHEFPNWVPEDARNFKINNVERYADRVHQSFERQGLKELWNTRMTHVGPGYVQLLQRAEKKVWNQTKTIHGGVLGALSDIGGGLCGLTLAPASHIILTTEYKINMLRPADGNLLIVRGVVIKPGNLVISQTHLYSCNVDPELLRHKNWKHFSLESLEKPPQLRLVATAIQTCMILEGTEVDLQADDHHLE